MIAPFPTNVITVVIYKYCGNNFFKKKKKENSLSNIMVFSFAPFVSSATVYRPSKRQKYVTKKH